MNNGSSYWSLYTFFSYQKLGLYQISGWPDTRPFLVSSRISSFIWQLAEFFMILADVFATRIRSIATRITRPCLSGRVVPVWTTWKIAYLPTMYQCTVAYNGHVTFYYVPDYQGHVFLVGLYLLAVWTTWPITDLPTINFLRCSRASKARGSSSVAALFWLGRRPTDRILKIYNIKLSKYQQGYIKFPTTQFIIS